MSFHCWQSCDFKRVWIWERHEISLLLISTAALSALTFVFWFPPLAEDYKDGDDDEDSHNDGSDHSYDQDDVRPAHLDGAKTWKADSTAVDKAPFDRKLTPIAFSTYEKRLSLCLSPLVSPQVLQSGNWKSKIEKVGSPGLSTRLGSHEKKGEKFGNKRGWKLSFSASKSSSKNLN